MQRVEVLSSWSEHRFRAMGTHAHVLVRGGPRGVERWMAREIERLESLWSRFRPGTDVARLNAASGEPVLVASETLDLIDHAVALWRETVGRFDPTILRALEANGYDVTFEQVRARGHRSAGLVARSAPAGRAPLTVTVPSPVTAPRPAPGCAGIEIDRDAGTVRLPRGVGLDLGGIGKGYAADLVCEAVLAQGAAGASVGIGGDVRCAGVGPDDGRWAIDVEDPFDEERVLFTGVLEDGALVTSTRRFRRWPHGGRWRHHVIDPATGMPTANGITAVIATDRHAWRAEAVAKAAMVAGRHDGADVLARAHVRGWLVGDDGQIVTVGAPASEWAA